MKKSIISVFICISGLLFATSSAIAADHSQTQNKVDDKMNSPKPIQTDSAEKKDAVTNKQNYDKNDVDMRDRKQMDDKRNESQSK
jgi:hypothetical protein